MTAPRCEVVNSIKLTITDKGFIVIVDGEEIEGVVSAEYRTGRLDVEQLNPDGSYFMTANHVFYCRNKPEIVDTRL